MFMRSPNAAVKQKLCGAWRQDVAFVGLQMEDEISSEWVWSALFTMGTGKKYCVECPRPGVLEGIGDKIYDATNEENRRLCSLQRRVGS